MSGATRRRRGVALATALLVSVLLLTLALSILTFAERDAYTQMQMERRLLALSMARSGLEFYRASAESFKENTPVTRTFQQGGYEQAFTVELLPGGSIRSVGTVFSGKRIVAEKVLFVPQGDFYQMYDPDL